MSSEPPLQTITIYNQGEQIIYLCEGKKELKRRSFGKVVGEAVELLKYAD